MKVETIKHTLAAGRLPLLLAALLSVPVASHAQPSGAADPLSCSSGATKGLLDQIYRKKDKSFLDTYAASRDVDRLLAATVLDFDAIRVEDRDAATGALPCAADFPSKIPPIATSQVFPNGVTKSGTAVYRVERTDDGGLYVTVVRGDRPY